MPDLNNLLMFVSASTLLALAPGPDNIFVLAQSIVHGRLAGMAIILGLCTGLVAHTAAVALGLAVVFKTSAVAFNIVKYCGVAYLLYLSWLSFRASASSVRMVEESRPSLWRFYRRGIFMNVTNPKVSIFFLAFLPQFTSPERGPIVIQIVLLGVLFIAVTIVVFGLISQLSGIIGRWINRSPRGQVMLHRVAGAVFLSLALKLVFTQQ